MVRMMVLRPVGSWLAFNLLKTSQSSLEVLTALGRLCGHAVLRKKSLGLPLHTAILKQVVGNLLSVDEAMDFDRKTW